MADTWTADQIHAAIHAEARSQGIAILRTEDLAAGTLRRLNALRPVTPEPPGRHRRG